MIVPVREKDAGGGSASFPGALLPLFVARSVKPLGARKGCCITARKLTLQDAWVDLQYRVRSKEA